MKKLISELPEMPQHLRSYTLNDLRVALENVREFQRKNPSSVKSDEYFMYLSCRFFHLFEFEEDSQPSNDPDLKLAIRSIEKFKSLSMEEQKHIIQRNDRRSLLEPSSW